MPIRWRFGNLTSSRSEIRRPALKPGRDAARIPRQYGDVSFNEVGPLSRGPEESRPMSRPFPILRVESLILLIALLVVAGPGRGETRDPGQYFFDQTFGDFQEELQKAKEEGKKGVLLMFEMDECPFCHRMKTTVLNQPEVQDFYKKNFLIFPVDVEGDVEITDFKGNQVPQKDFALKDFRVRATPVFAFFDLDGNLVSKYIGATRDAEEFMWLGEYVAEGRYQELPFAKYKRERQASADK
jgi:thioredoxin-related protein